MDYLEALKDIIEVHGKGKTQDLIGLGEAQINNYLRRDHPISKRAKLLIMAESEKLNKKKKA